MEQYNLDDLFEREGTKCRRICQYLQKLSHENEDRARDPEKEL